LARNQTLSKWTPTSPFVFHHISAKTYQILAKHVTKVSIHDILQAYASLLTVAEEINHGGLYKNRILEIKKRNPPSSVELYRHRNAALSQALGPQK